MLLCQPVGVGLGNAAVSMALPGTDHSHHAAGPSQHHDAAASVGGDTLEIAGDPSPAHADHQCSICALCGHAMALAPAPVATDARSAPQVLTLGLTPRIACLGHPVPDKPPRA